MNIYEVIKSVIVSEKALNLKERSPGTNQVITLRVNRASNKADIKNAVEAFFNVKVDSVNTINYLGKKVRRGRISGKKSDWKKAYVRLAAGYSISDYLEAL